MNCPVCDAQLRTVTKHNVEVDICPDCKGVWLDRGELEKIIEMASAGGPAGYREEPAPRIDEREYRRDPERYDQRPAERHEHRDDRRDEQEYRERDEHHGRGEYDPRHGRRRGSWLGDILGAFGEGGDD